MLDYPQYNYTPKYKEFYIKAHTWPDRVHNEDGAIAHWPDGSYTWALDNKFYSKQDYFIELEKPRGKEHADMIRLIYA